MFISAILDQLNISKKCKKYNIKLWQCPDFLFTIMGLVVITSMLGTYGITTLYNAEPEIIVLITVITTIILLIIGQLIINNFEQLANLNKAKSEFISMASHQLRAPLSNLKWTLNLLMEKDFDLPKDQIKEYLSLVEKNNERMIKLVNDLLQISKIETNSVKLFFKKDVFIPDIIKRAIDRLTPFIEASEITIKLDYEQNLPKIMVDVEYLEIVARNIIDNAIKYNRGKGEILISIKKDDNFLKTTIQDNGMGISHEHQKHIFKNLFKTEDSAGRSNGNGFGLYIAQAIINAHNGKIGFKSKEGEGTTFWFILPIK